MMKPQAPEVLVWKSFEGTTLFEVPRVHSIPLFCCAIALSFLAPAGNAPLVQELVNTVKSGTSKAQKPLVSPELDFAHQISGLDAGLLLLPSDGSGNTICASMDCVENVGEVLPLNGDVT